MVAAIELAGVVVVVLLSIIQALSAYKSGLEKTDIILNPKQQRYKVKVGRLRQRLEGQRMSFRMSLLKLIGRAAPAEDIACLPELYDDIL